MKVVRGSWRLLKERENTVIWKVVIISLIMKIEVTRVFIHDLESKSLVTN